MTKNKLARPDLIIIGAGPSALTAAIYAARECLNVEVIERAFAGGQAAITDMIDNYPGFPEGINGFELADRMKRQAERFGVKISQAEVVGLTKKSNGISVDTGPGESLVAKAVLVSTGSSYMKLGVPGEAEFYGKGVHYCATCDGAFYKDKTIAVIGGGNSAVQEAIFLTKFARTIHLVSLFKLSASEILKAELKKFIDKKQIIIHEDTRTTRIEAEGNKVSCLKVEKSSKEADIKIDGVFVFIGLKPNTQFLKDGEIELDKYGFIKTDQSFMTNIPGVFASGDVRSGAVMQVACAVGEGAAAALAIRDYLEK